MSGPQVSASPPPGGRQRAQSSRLVARPDGEPSSPDLTAPVDRVHLDSIAALAVVRADFDAAHKAVGAEADRFAADIEALVAGADGWEPVQQLAQRRPA